jgi:hypothetical protein
LRVLLYSTIMNRFCVVRRYRPDAPPISCGYSISISSPGSTTTPGINTSQADSATTTATAATAASAASAPAAITATAATADMTPVGAPRLSLASLIAALTRTFAAIRGGRVMMSPSPSPSPSPGPSPGLGLSCQCHFPAQSGWRVDIGPNPADKPEASICHPVVSITIIDVVNYNAGTVFGHGSDLCTEPSTILMSIIRRVFSLNLAAHIE